MEERTSTAWNYWTQKAFGANLGNWLILEEWMGDDVFTQAAKSLGENTWTETKDEWTLTRKTPKAAELLKRHWNSWITERDFETMASVKVNHIRIPVGYWAFIPTQDEEPYVTDGQKAQIERILGYCAKYNMYAIIDLHGLPGSQNGEVHSGQIRKIEDIRFFTEVNVDRGLEAVQAVVDWMNGLNSDLKYQIAGIEAANEPHPTSEDQLDCLRDYYQRAYDIIAASAFKVPMLFHDAFKGPDAWRDFLPPPANAVLDLHPYWVFGKSKEDVAKEMDYTAVLQDIGLKLSGDNNFHLPVLYGEWSLASRIKDLGNTRLHQFMDTQVSVYQHGNAAGAIFWSLKNRKYKEWSFEWLVRDGIINDNTFSSHVNAKF